MLVELRVLELGVIDELSLVLDGGMTALTGETGAGKTLAGDGGRAPDGRACRHGDGATRRGRGGGRGTVRRRGPRGGDPTRRSGEGSQPRLHRRAPGHPRRTGRHRRRALVDLHGQHDHQSLLAAAVQREAPSTGSPASISRRSARRVMRFAGSRESWPDSAATSGNGPVNSTCCGSRSVSSTTLRSPTPRRMRASPTRRTCCPMPSPIARPRPSPSSR